MYKEKSIKEHMRDLKYYRLAASLLRLKQKQNIKGYFENAKLCFLKNYR